jgi:hypothetical protein
MELKKKQNSYAMQLIKPSTSGHLGCFDMMVILASMGDTRQRVHMSDPLFYSSLSLLSLALPPHYAAASSHLLSTLDSGK